MSYDNQNKIRRWWSKYIQYVRFLVHDTVRGVLDVNVHAESPRFLWVTNDMNVHIQSSRLRGEYATYTQTTI